MLIGSDHAGFELKNRLKDLLSDEGIHVIDVGCGDETSCDYPVFAKELCRRVLAGEAPEGIIVCGSGIGMSMAANRFQGIRAALCTTEYHARMARAHNDANVLCLGGRITGPALAEAILKAWLETEFEGGRHLKRVNLIDE